MHPYPTESVNDKKIVALLKDGAVGVLPTDTVNGLVCPATNKEAVMRLYSLKQREQKPGTILASSLEQLIALGLKKRYLKAVEHYWPGPISIVIPGGPELSYLHQGKGTLAVRITSDKKLNMLIDKVGPLLSSSANQPGQPPANSIKEARGYFGHNVDFYVDGGDMSERKPSTVIRIIDDAVEVLRAGAVTINESGRIIK